MANRHKAFKKGGKVEEEVSSKVETEAKEKNKGGAVVKRKEGGKRADHHRHEVVGRASGSRLDKRARGGGVGADKHPFSSAHIKG